MARQRMLEADRETYGIPEWVDFLAAVRWIDDLDYDRLLDIETQIKTLLSPLNPDTDVTLLWFMSTMLARAQSAGSIPMLRTRLWLAVLAAGADVKLDDFKPHVYATEWERPAKGAADADPPSGSPESSDASTQEPANTPASESSTSASIPGPAAATE